VTTSGKPLPGVFETFPALDAFPFAKAVFLRRVAGVDVDADRETALLRLKEIHAATLEAVGFAGMAQARATQVHGNHVALVGPDTPFPVPDCDGLVTTARGVVLGIHVADCAAVYLVDNQGRGIGLAHSGRKGTELDITTRLVETLAAATGGHPRDFVLQISPCIRPPHYEVDFAAEIARQAARAGVGEVHDCGRCTASLPADYYSHRREAGRTGRLLAAIALLPA
jgi:polyphenol oxidase